MPIIRYLLYTFGVVLLTGYFAWAEISTPGSLKLLVYESAEDTLGTSEYSPLEMVQPVMLIVCAMLFGWVARDVPLQRPIACLFGGIAASAAIRELDLFLDRTVADNFWQLPVGMIAALVIVYTFRHRRRFRVAWLRLWPSAGLALLYAGALIEFVFAQLIGHQPLWQAIAGDGYQRIVKVTVEELIELMGYCLWVIGSIEYALQARSLRPREPDSGSRRRRRPS
ncbi:MAG: hypothetical protein AAGA44_16950 [Pseudomonadota bacterium]